MTNVNIEDLVTAWIALAHAQKESQEHERLFWAHGAFWNLCREEPDTAWDAILTVLARNPDARVVGNLAAGPMEDLLVHNGPAVIERVEERARSDVAVAALLGGVWKNDIDDDIWKRIEAVRSHIW